MSARSVALRLLSGRDYTTAEIRAKLLERECEAEEVETTIRGLMQEGLLNDRRTGAAHVRTAIQIKNRGRLRIRRELEARGIDRAVVAEVLAEAPETDDAAGIEKFLLRKRLPPTLGPGERRRLFGQLMRRGFSAEAIGKALRQHGTDEE